MLGKMKLGKSHKYSTFIQCLISAAVVVASAALCSLLFMPLGYKTVALILLMTVSVLAIMLDILPVLLAATLSALIWNFFFIPPVFTFHIDNTEDLLMFLMYFVIALVNAVLMFKIRDAEQKARDKEERENAIKLYNTLLNSLSHEMRTPLATIIGAIDTIKENQNKLSKINNDYLLSEIEIASTRLNRQVENLLNMSRIETGMLKLKKDWCDVNELIFSVIQKFTESGITHKVEFIPNENLPLFKLDEGLMEQVIHNLLDNAIQYTSANSIIKISADLKSEKFEFEISDNGKGFSESEIEHIFEKFYRIPNTKTGGSGLGLSIVKGFVEAHNGNVLVENSKSGGAKFSISIPAETSFIMNLKNE